MELNMVAKLIPEQMKDRGKRPTLVVALKILDILEEEGSGAMPCQNLGDLVKECALYIAEEAMWATESILLRNPGNRKGLTGKTR